jgi:drug/metabolite transporter (DMT)-like permease
MIAKKNNEAIKKDKIKHIWLGYFIGMLGAAFFATKGIVIKLALLENVDVLTTLTWRMIIAVPFFIIIGYFGYKARKKKNPNFYAPRDAIFKTAILGMVGYYLASYLDFAGLEYISAQFDRLILLTNPFFVVLFGAIIFKRKVGLMMIISLLISYSGLALIFFNDLKIDGNDVVIGSLLVLGAAIFYALYQLFAKPLIDIMGARLFTSIALSAAGFAVILHFSLTHEFSDLIVSQNAMWLMGAMGTISMVIPAYLISTSIGMIGAEPTAVMGNISPIITIILAVSILGEAFSFNHAVGATLVLAGMFAFTYFERRT